MLPQNTTSAELLLGMHVDAMVVQHLLHVRSFAPLLVLYENKQIVNDTEHIQYIPHILLNTPQLSSVYRYILIYTPYLHTPETSAVRRHTPDYSNSLSQDVVHRN
ncbi:hypothetical protein T03_12088 [Trichinella britovi]|uniref:Uncharacterized protein n=1 Tax=Trichinella britovi TaxID=45882 RepID=A0A0V1C628_TRIBR|nr:hypothetical protein T03_12088 [Trichinella britovi]